jgi:hypothetical protein
MKKHDSMSTKEPIQRFLSKFIHKKDIGTVFKDRLQLSVASFSRDEEMYMEIANRYSKEELEHLASALGDLVIEMEKTIDSPEQVSKDILGHLYEGHITF